MKKMIASILCIVLFAISMTTITYASATTIKIDEISCSAGATVDVPITISGNTGIAGAVIKISYDSNLKLLAVTKGGAFSSLVYTPPAKLTSNPITLLWDGIEDDISNGTIATLTFSVPDTAGTYNVSASYETGGIYDEDLNDISVVIENGSITASNEPSISASITDKVNVVLELEGKIEGTVYVALFGENNSLIELQSCPAKKSIETSFENISRGKYIKVFWWDKKTPKPYCDAIIVNL